MDRNPFEDCEMRIEVYNDEERIGRTGDFSRLPSYMNPVELSADDAEIASDMLEKPVLPGSYTPKDGDLYSVAMAATFKGARVYVQLFP
jgi:hypothetical protein